MNLSKSETLVFIRENRPIRWTLYVLGTVLLGALGSGFWELALKDMTVSLGNFSLTLMATVWGGYVDSLHADIGKLYTDVLSTPSFIVITAVAILGGPMMTIWLLQAINDLRKKAKDDLSTLDKPEPPLTLESVLQKYKEVDAKGVALRRSICRTLLPLVAIASITFALMTLQLLYTRNAGNWAERSIEILRPRLSVEEHLALRSRLRAIASANDFYQLESELKTLQDRVGTRLPAFTSVRPLGRQK